MSRTADRFRRGSTVTTVGLSLMFGVLAMAAPASSIENRVLAARPGDTLSFTVGDDIQVFNVTREALVGDSVELQRFPGHLRGRVGSEPIDLALEAPRITGRIGVQPVSLDMLPSKDGIQVAGRFGAREIAVHFRVAAIDGAVGPCRYQLKLTHGEYQGDVGCGAEPEQVRLQVPVALVARSDAELTAMLVAILAR